MKPTRPNREAMLALLVDEPWALPLTTLSLIIEGVRNWPDMEWAAVMGRKPAPATRAGTLAVIPVYGMLEQRASIFDEFFGLTSIESLNSSLRDALADPGVRAIVLDMDSPGGSVAGITELAGTIRGARGQGKPIVAHANTLMASAAYWLGAQADEVIVSPSASVGSVGIVAVHQEFSKALEAEGVTTTIISSGKFKTEGNPFEPLTDEAKAHLQERSDAFYAQFIGDVSKGRNVPIETVRSSFGQGRVVMATEALKAGMVDRVEAFDATLARLSRANGGAQPVRAEGDALEEDIAPFHEQVATIADLAATRARLRAKEGRPAFSTDTAAGLRTIRDSLDALLAPDQPAAASGTPEQPAPSTEALPPKSKPTLRPVSREEFLAKLARS